MEHFSVGFRALHWLFARWGGFEYEAGIHVWAPVVLALGCGAVFLVWFVWMLHVVIPRHEAADAIGCALRALGERLHGAVLPSVHSDGM